MSFTAQELYQSIIKVLPDFKISYKPDFRQDIANTWPDSIDDTAARNDWGWKPKYDLDTMTRVMIEKLKENYN